MTTPDIDGFAGRHIGPSVDEQAKMLAVVGHGSRADLVDQPTAAAEAMSLCRRSSKSTSTRFVVDADCHPQTLAVLQTRAEPVGIEVVVADLRDGLPAGELFGLLVSFPGSSGAVRDLAA